MVNFEPKSDNLKISAKEGREEAIEEGRKRERKEERNGESDGYGKGEREGEDKGQIFLCLNFHVIMLLFSGFSETINFHGRHE